MKLSSDTPFTADANEKVLISGTFRFQAGESRRVFGRLETTSTIAAEVGLEAAVRCLDDSRDQQHSGISAWTARNHVGTGPLALSPSLLFTAPTAGTYTRQLIAQTGIPNKGGNHLTAVADGTWLQVSSSDEVGAQWWQNPDCNSEGTEPTSSAASGTSKSPAHDDLGRGRVSAVTPGAADTTSSCRGHVLERDGTGWNAIRCMTPHHRFGKEGPR